MASSGSDICSRFWSKVKTVESGCMEWQGSLTANGYGKAYDFIKKDMVGAHRLSISLSGIGVRHGEYVLHSCDNKKCVNPLHLRAGTHQDNMRDVALRKRSSNIKKTHCPKGHPYSGENLVMDDGARRCLICRRKLSNNYYEKNRKKLCAAAALRRKLNPEKIKEASRLYREKNRENILARQRLWAATQKEKRESLRE